MKPAMFYKKRIDLLVIFSLAFGISKVVMPRHVFSYSSIPNDTNINSQWAIQKVGLDSAWNIFTGSSSTKVGIIDSGIDANHEDLSTNVNSALAHYFGNDNLNPLQDGEGHGTHVSGIIGAKGNNNLGVSGACWDANLVPLSIATNNFGEVYIPGIADAIQYSSSSNSSISLLNSSLGIAFSSISSHGYNALGVIGDFNTNMGSYDGLLICAAGNGQNLNSNDPFGKNIDSFSNYIFPASYSKPNMIVVGNSKSDDYKAVTSNYGSSKVDLFAPGEAILSTIPNNNYATFSGTSMAAPLVTGTAALLKSIDPTLTSAQIKAAILNNVDTVSALSGLCSTGGRLNAYKAALSILEEIEADGDPVSFVSNINYQKFMKINCVPGHYTLSIESACPCKVIIYQNYNGIPLGQVTLTDPGFDTISFLSSTNQIVFVRVENLGTTNENIELTLSYQNHLYINHYQYFSPSYHRAYCACGAFVLMPHIVYGHLPDDITGVCALCSVIVPINAGNNVLLDTKKVENSISFYSLLDKTIIQCY